MKQRMRNQNKEIEPNRNEQNEILCMFRKTTTTKTETYCKETFKVCECNCSTCVYVGDISMRRCTHSNGDLIAHT